MFQEIILFGGTGMDDFVKELVDLPDDGINLEGKGGPECLSPKA